MRTNLDIDDEPVRETLEVTGMKTKREAVEEGLRLLLRMRRQASLRDLRGIGWEGNLDDMRRDKIR